MIWKGTPLHVGATCAASARVSYARARACPISSGRLQNTQTALLPLFIPLSSDFPLPARFSTGHRRAIPVVRTPSSTHDILYFGICRFQIGQIVTIEFRSRDFSKSSKDSKGSRAEFLLYRLAFYGDVAVRKVYE